MLDRWMRKKIDAPLNRIARRLVLAGASANGLTLAGFALGLASAGAIAQGAYLMGLGLFLLNRLFDGLDGPVARLRGASDFGGYLDVVCDFIVYNALVVGFLLADPRHVLPSAFLLLSFVGTGTSFLAYAIIAAKRGQTHQRQGAKAFYYLGGLAEGTETITFFVATCLWPSAYVWLAWAFAALCGITTLARIMAAKRDFTG